MAMSLSSVLGGGAASGASSTPSSQGGGTTSADHPLVALGLIDPSGFDASQRQGQGTEQDATDNPQQQQSAEPDWENDSNPYKTKATELEQRLSANPQVSDPRVSLQQQTQVIESQANAALAQFMAGPVAQGQMTPQIAQLVVNSAKMAAIAQAQLESERAVLMPAAKRTVAERIAQQTSSGKVKIDPSELLSEPTVEAMQARAKTLAEGRRNGNFETRKTSKVDKVEGGTTGGTIDAAALSQLSPAAIIKLGVMRGHTGR